MEQRMWGGSADVEAEQAGLAWCGEGEGSGIWGGGDLEGSLQGAEGSEATAGCTVGVAGEAGGDRKASAQVRQGIAGVGKGPGVLGAGRL